MPARSGESVLPISARFPVGLISLFFFAGCGEEKAATRTAVDEIFPVEVIAVQQQSLRRTLNAVGTVRYRRETPLGFTTSGKVASVRFDEGDYVQRGVLLAALDATSTGADLSAASAERDRARSELERIRSLYADGWVTKARFETAEATYKLGDARLRQAGFASGTAQLYAPSSGVILARNVEPGQIVSAGTAALVLGQGDEGFVFRVPIIDLDASQLRVGMAADIDIRSLEGAPITATISEIDGRANEATGAFTVQFRLAGRPRLRSGQIGRASIMLPAANNGSLQIPASALFGVRTGEGLVYVVGDQNRVETRNVVIERVTDGFVIVTGGIKPGDRIVTSGTEKLRSGSRVRPVTTAK